MGTDQTHTNFGCWSFTFWQHLRSYQDGYRLVLSMKLLWLYRAGTTTRFPTQPHYLDTELNLSFPYPGCVDYRLASDKYQFCKSLFWLSWDRTPDFLHGKSALLTCLVSISEINILCICVHRLKLIIIDVNHILVWPYIYCQQTNWRHWPIGGFFP